MRLLPSDGSSANLQLLRDGQADLAVVQAALPSCCQTIRTKLVSLGSLFVEPVWVFYRTEAAAGTQTLAGRAAALPGCAGNVGGVDGVPWLMNQLLEANRLEAVR